MCLCLACLPDELVPDLRGDSGLLALLDVGAHADESGRLLGDVQVVARDHLHPDAGPDEVRDGLLRVVPRRVQHRHDAHELEGAVVDLHRDAQGLVAGLAEVSAMIDNYDLEEGEYLLHG